MTISAFAVSANAVAPLVSTLSESIGVRAASFGLFIAIQFLAFSAASFAGGIAREKWRLTNHHLVAAGLAVITLALFLAPAALRSPAAILLWVVPLGLAGGAVETFSSVEIARLSGSGGSRNLCLSQAFYSIGAFAAPQIVYLCFTAGLGWKSTFLVFGLVALAIGSFFVRRSRGKLRRAPPGRGREAGGRPAGKQGNALFAALLSLVLIYDILESLTAAWLPYVYEVTYSLPAREAALALALFWAGMILGRFAIVLLPLRYTVWPALLSSAVLAFLAACALAAVGQQAARYALAFLLGAAAGPLWPVLVMTSSVSFRSQRRTASVIGVGAVGFACGPLLGSLILRGGLAFRFFQIQALLAAAVLLLCLLGFALRRRAAHPEAGCPETDRIP